MLSGRSNNLMTLFFATQVHLADTRHKRGAKKDFGERAQSKVIWVLSLLEL